MTNITDQSRRSLRVRFYPMTIRTLLYCLQSRARVNSRQVIQSEIIKIRRRGNEDVKAGNREIIIRSMRKSANAGQREL